MGCDKGTLAEHSLPRLIASIPGSKEKRAKDRMKGGEAFGNWGVESRMGLKGVDPPLTTHGFSGFGEHSTTLFFCASYNWSWLWFFPLICGQFFQIPARLGNILIKKARGGRSDPPPSGRRGGGGSTRTLAAMAPHMENISSPLKAPEEHFLKIGTPET